MVPPLPLLAALLQKRANSLPLWEGLDAATNKATQAVYNDVFQVRGFHSGLHGYDVFPIEILSCRPDWLD